MKVIDIVKDGKLVTFTRYKHGCLWYVTQDKEFEFPVPAGDIDGEAELHTTERAMSLMKWIKKHIDFIEAAKVAE